MLFRFNHRKVTEVFSFQMFLRATCGPRDMDEPKYAGKRIHDIESKHS